MPKYRILRHRTFDFDMAKERVWYTLEEYKKGLFGREKWRPVKEYFFDTGGGCYAPVSGDRQWAFRIAKELGIEVPKND